jgi:hypothetical protein
MKALLLMAQSQKIQQAGVSLVALYLYSFKRPATVSEITTPSRTALCRRQLTKFTVDGCFSWWWQSIKAFLESALSDRGVSLHRPEPPAGRRRRKYF